MFTRSRIRRILIQKSGHNERARVVVGCIALARVGHGEDRVLQHACVVGHGQQMTGIQHRQMFGRISPHASSCWAALGCKERSKRAR